MPPKYEIRLRNSFLEFSSPEPSTPWHKRSLSCPCLWGAPSDRDGGGTSSLEVEVSPASASVSTNEPQDPEAIGSGCEEDAPKSLDNVCAQKQVPCPERSTKSTRMQVKINKALQGNACSTFKVIHKELHRMNAVNLATSIHRIVRDRVPHGDEIEIFNALLVVMEKQALRELSHHDGSMPANCATIIAWSCASLQVFRPSLFAALIQVATLGLSTCQAFEVTNLLWACANLLTTSMSTMTVEMKTLLSDLMDAVELFLHEHLHELNGQVLVSALVSIATLYPMHLCDGLFESVCNTLVLRCKELSFKQKSNVQIACRIMSRHNMQRVQDLSQRVCQKCPEMAFYVSLG